MPQIKFTDTAIAKLKADKTTWFSDPSVKGLRLCVTPGGVKTWYVVRWDATAQKTRQIKLGPWAAKGTHTVWAKNQIGKVVLDITDGRARTRSERAEERAGVPTLRGAFERDLTTRTTRGAAYGGPIHDKTTQGYRATFDKYLGTWADLKVDALDHAAVQRLLDDLAIQDARLWAGLSLLPRLRLNAFCEEVERDADAFVGQHLLHRPLAVDRVAIDNE